METTKAYISTLPPPFAFYDEQLTDISSTFQPSRSPTFLYPISVDPAYSSPHGRLTSESFAVPRRSTHMDHVSSQRGINTPTISIGHTSDQGASGASAVLDTRKWSPTQNHIMPYRSTLESQWTSSYMGSDALLSLPNGATNIAPTRQVALLPDIPETCPSFISSTPYHCPDPSTQFTYPVPLANVMAPAPSVSLSSPTGDGRPHSQSRRIVNIGGLWIDRDDLSSRAGPCNNMISVHECQWEKSSNPCGMWIAGSRSRVGAHIRKWHKKQHANDSARCLWDGCTKTMGIYSINRHVVTVHFGEGFHCQGCGQEFSRKDVYRKHAEDSEVCRDVVAAAVYSKKCRMIDARQALRGEASPHYAGR